MRYRKTTATLRIRTIKCVANWTAGFDSRERERGEICSIVAGSVLACVCGDVVAIPVSDCVLSRDVTLRNENKNTNGNEINSNCCSGLLHYFWKTLLNG